MATIFADQAPTAADVPPGKCQGDFTLKHDHAQKAISCNLLTPNCRVWCIPERGREKPPHDGATKSSNLSTKCLTKDDYDTIASEAKVLLSVKPLEGQWSTGGAALIGFCKANVGHLYIHQVLTRINTWYSSDRVIKRIFRNVFYEDFLLDGLGESIDEDPHCMVAAFPEYCKMHVEETAQLSLIWKKPESFSGKHNLSFHFYGAESYEGVGIPPRWVPHVGTNPDADLTSRGQRHFAVVQLGAYGEYSQEYDIAHCVDSPIHTMTPTAPRDPELGTISPPDTGRGVSTPRDPGGGTTTPRDPSPSPSGGNSGLPANDGDERIRAGL